MDFSQFKKNSKDDIYLAIKKDILTLNLKPGQRISENEISVKYNVSRTPVKTAFLYLRGERLIEIVPQTGTFVTLLDLDLIREIVMIRKTMEAQVINSIIANLSDETLQLLRDNLEQQYRIVTAEYTDPIEFYDVDSKFHEICFETAGRKKLWHIIQDFQVHYTRFRMLDYINMGKLDHIYHEHLEMLELLEKRRIDMIDAFLHKHLFGNFGRLGQKLHTEFREYFV